MELIDSHCHIYGKEFAQDFPEMLQRAAAALAEMPADRLHPRARNEQRFDLRATPLAPALEKPRAQLIAGGAERQKDGLAAPERDAVAALPDALDRQGHRFAAGLSGAHGSGTQHCLRAR